jgi:hypothetical protein
MGAMNEFKVLDPNGHSRTAWDPAAQGALRSASTRASRRRCSCRRSMPAERSARPWWRSLLRALRRGVERRGRLAGHHLPAQRLAAERSRELLVACLNEAQRAEFEHEHSFRVRGQSGRCYRIAFGTVANIEVLGENGEVAYRLCAGPVQLPTPAVMLAQKLMLETRESEFLALAARHPALLAPPAFAYPAFADAARPRVLRMPG